MSAFDSGSLMSFWRPFRWSLYALVVFASLPQAFTSHRSESKVDRRTKNHRFGASTELGASMARLAVHGFILCIVSRYDGRIWLRFARTC